MKENYLCIRLKIKLFKAFTTSYELSQLFVQFIFAIERKGGLLEATSRSRVSVSVGARDTSKEVDKA